MIQRLKGNIGLIQRVELLTMLSKMAASYAPKTYLTNSSIKSNLILILNVC